MSLSDEYICTLLLKDNRRGIHLLFQKYFADLVVWADTFLDDIDLAKDIVQELFLYIWQGEIYKKLTPDTLGSFLRVAVKNRCYNQHKKKDILRYYNEIANIEYIYEEYQQNNEEIIAAVFNEIEKLPTQSRKVIKCVYIEGLKYNETAEALNISVSTVKTHLVNAMKKLRLRSKKFNHLLLFWAIFKPSLSFRDEK